MKFRDFKSARALARSVPRVRSERAWRHWCRNSGEKPADVPNYPDHVYRNQGWQGWPDFLGTSTTRPKAAKNFSDRADEYETVIRQHGAAAIRKSGRFAHLYHWRQLIRSKYRHHRQDFTKKQLQRIRSLGLLSTQPPEYRSFAAARQYARRKQIRSIDEWRALTKTAAFPVDIPVRPHHAYSKTGWAGWHDFLGLKCTDAPEFAQRLALYRSYVRQYGPQFVSERAPLDQDVAQLRIWRSQLRQLYKRDRSYVPPSLRPKLRRLGILPDKDW